jgi:hypothetical protein
VAAMKTLPERPHPHVSYISTILLYLVLTSWWDVYETLANILKMVEQPYTFDPLLVNWQPTTAGISLFHPIPERNCSSAGIPRKNLILLYISSLSTYLFSNFRQILSMFT